MTPSSQTTPNKTFIQILHDLEFSMWHRLRERMDHKLFHHIKSKTWMRSDSIEQNAIALEVEVGTWDANP